MHILPVVPESGADGAAGDGDLGGALVGDRAGGVLESGWGGSGGDERWDGLGVKGGCGREMGR